MTSEVLYKVCKSIQREHLELFLLEKIYEYIYDRDLNIRLEAIDLLVDLVEKLSPEILQNKICNLFLELMSSVNDEILIRFSRHAGIILQKVFLFTLHQLI